MSKVIEPTPYPQKMPVLFPQKPINSTDFPTQVNILKTELGCLENKYESLLKLFNKTDKKLKDQQEHVKKFKQINDTLFKENIILKKTIQKLNNDKAAMEKTNDENKKYIIKIEQKLLNGVKDQFLIEQNTKLKNRVDEMEMEKKKILDKEEYINKEKEKIDEKIKILQKALKLKIDEFKSKDIKIDEETLIEIGIKKEQYDNLKSNNLSLSKENKELKDLSKDFEEKLQAINYAKSKLTEMLVEKENLINDLLSEKQAFEYDIEQLTTEKNILQKYFEDNENKEKNIQKEIENEINKNNNIITSLELQVKDLTDKLNIANNKIETLEKSLDLVNNKNLKIEQLYKENMEQNALFRSEVETLKNECDRKIIEFDKIKLSNENYQKIINDLNNKLHEIENENINLISNLNKQTFEKDYVQNDLIRQNNQIQNNIKILEEKIIKLTEENEIISKEKNEYKNLLNQIYNRSEDLTKDDNDFLAREKTRDSKINLTQNSKGKNYYNDKENGNIMIEENFNKDDSVIIKEKGKEIEKEKEKKNVKEKDRNKKFDLVSEDKSITPIILEKDIQSINSFIGSSLEDNSNDLSKNSYIPIKRKKTDKLLEMIRKERNKKKLLDIELKKIGKNN